MKKLDRTLIIRIDQFHLDMLNEISRYSSVRSKSEIIRILIEEAWLKYGPDSLRHEKTLMLARWGSSPLAGGRK